MHQDPSNFYPFYAGFADEHGSGAGEGFNLNLPLSARYGDDACLEALGVGLARIRDFGPDLLFVSLGLDAHRSDPHGSGGITTEGVGRVAAAIGSLGFPAVLIQEGGYLSPDLGPALGAFLAGMHR